MESRFSFSIIQTYIFIKPKVWMTSCYFCSILLLAPTWLKEHKIVRIFISVYRAVWLKVLCSFCEWIICIKMCIDKNKNLSIETTSDNRHFQSSFLMDITFRCWKTHWTEIEIMLLSNLSEYTHEPQWI